MDYKKRLLWLLLASVLTAGVAYYMTDITVSLSAGLEDKFGYALGFALMLFVSYVGLVVASIPSTISLKFAKLPNWLPLSIVAATEAFLLSCMITPLTISLLGFGYWALTMFVCLLASYLVSDLILNRIDKDKTNKQKIVVATGMVAVSALLLILFLAT